MIPWIFGEYPAAMKSYKMTPAELKELQSRRLRRMMDFAYRRVPLYHDAMRKSGVLPGDITCVKDLERLPLLTREIAEANSPTRTLARGVRVSSFRNTTGTTTGRPLRVYRGPLTERRIVALKLRRMHYSGVHWWEKAVYMPYWGTDVVGTAHMDGPRLPGPGRKFSSIWLKARDPVAGYRVLPIGSDNMAMVARSVVRYKPSILRARPSYLRRMKMWVKRYDPDFETSKIFTEGETLSRGSRADLEDSYGGRVFDGYGSTEFSELGFECSSHEGVHLDMDYFAFEFFGADGEEVGPGEAAELVVSGLVDDAMPLLRYRLGDRVVLGEEGRCGCGSYLPRLRRIEGRVNDGLITADGTLVPPGELVEHLETSVGLRGFQIVQENQHELLLRLDFGENREEVIDSVRRYLSMLLGGDVSVRAEVWGEREMPVKFRPVIKQKWEGRGLPD